MPPRIQVLWTDSSMVSGAVGSHNLVWFEVVTLEAHTGSVPMIFRTGVAAQ